jgi:hypothetical protein
MSATTKAQPTSPEPVIVATSTREAAEFIARLIVATSGGAR